MATRLLLKQEELQGLLFPHNLPSHDSSMTRYLDTDGYFRICENGIVKKEHRLVWEQHYDACLLSWGHIHHKNHIRTDNRIGNLEAMTISQHTIQHITGNHFTKGKHWYWKKDTPGRKKSEEHKRKISEATLGKPKRGR